MTRLSFRLRASCQPAARRRVPALLQVRVVREVTQGRFRRHRLVPVVGGLSLRQVKVAQEAAPIWSRRLASVVVLCPMNHFSLP